MGRKGNEKKIGNPVKNMVSVTEKLRGSQTYSKKKQQTFLVSVHFVSSERNYYLPIDCNGCRSFTDIYYTQIF